MKNDIKGKIKDLAKTLENFDKLVCENYEVFDTTNLKLHGYYKAMDHLKEKNIVLNDEEFNRYFEMYCDSEFEFFNSMIEEKGLQIIYHHKRSDIFITSAYSHDILTNILNESYVMEEVSFDNLICSCLEVEGYSSHMDSFTSYEDMVKDIIKENIDRDYSDSFEDYLSEIDNLILALEKNIEEFINDTFKELKEVHRILENTKENIEENLSDFITSCLEV